MVMELLCRMIGEEEPKKKGFYLFLFKQEASNKHAINSRFIHEIRVNETRLVSVISRFVRTSSTGSVMSWKFIQNRVNDVFLRLQHA